MKMKIQTKTNVDFRKVPDHLDDFNNLVLDEVLRPIAEKAKAQVKLTFQIGRDINKGKDFKPLSNFYTKNTHRKPNDRPLVDTGKLFKSVKLKTNHKKPSATVGSNIDYGELHIEGGMEYLPEYKKSFYVPPRQWFYKTEEEAVSLLQSDFNNLPPKFLSKLVSHIKTNFRKIGKEIVI